MKDVFRIMGIEPGAPPDAIRSAYRDLARVWHPDRFPNDGGVGIRVQGRFHRGVLVRGRRIGPRPRGVVPLEQRGPHASGRPEKSHAWGFHDMHGNVWEWTNDWFGKYSERQESDPTGPVLGVFRVKRGGGWFYEAFQCRSTYRSNFAPHFRDHLTGFRLARRG